MSDELYNRALIVLARSGLGAGRLDPADASAKLDNALCGDRITLDLRGEASAITEVGHKTRGCILIEASAAIIARHAPGLSAEEAAAMADKVTAYLKDEGPAPDWPDMALFAPVKAIASRHDCVLLPFRTLAEAAGDLAHSSQTSSKDET